MSCVNWATFHFCGMDVIKTFVSYKIAFLTEEEK